MTRFLCAWAAAAALVAAACSPRLDCDKFAKRASGPCQVAMLMYVFDVKPPMVVRAKKRPCFQRFFKRGVKQMCKHSKGIESEATEVAECLAKKDCKDFAICYRAVMIKRGWLKQVTGRR